MTITIGPNTYVACIVFIASNTQDVMGGLIKESVLSKEWTFHYRVRYYKSGTASTTDPFSDEDEKRSYVARRSCTEAEALAMIKDFVRDMVRKAMPDAHTVEIVPVNGGIDAVVRGAQGQTVGTFQERYGGTQMNLKIDKHRYAVSERYATGVFVRAQHESGEWESADIWALDRESLLEWLRSRGGNNVWAENVVGVLLGHGALHDGEGPVVVLGDDK